MNDTPDEAASPSASAHVDSSSSDKAEPNGAHDADNEAALQAAIAELRAENAGLRDKLLRTIAEMENFRRRADREKTDVSKYAVSEFARECVTIGDNLRRAIEAVQKEPLEQNPALRTLLEGVEVTERELIKVFERHGITRFDPIGEKFDPHLHEAMIKVDVPNVPADIIVQVLQAGYKIADRVLRPAAVIVAKGGTAVRPAASPQREAEGGQAEAAAMNGEHGGRTDRPGDGNVRPFHEHDPDVVREPTGAPKHGGQGPRRQDKSGGEKRASSVTKPVTENSAPIKNDELISSFGKRLENGS